MAELCPISQTVEEIVKKPRISRTNSVDPTSWLPDHVLHSIFSYLRSEDLFHVRLVSKNCHRNTPSCFTLDFDESIFFEKTPTTPAAVIQESHSKFLDWIRSSLETSQTTLQLIWIFVLVGCCGNFTWNVPYFLLVLIMKISVQIFLILRLCSLALVWHRSVSEFRVQHSEN